MKLTPALTPHALRDATIGGYLRGYRAHGIMRTAEQVEREVIADFHLVDAARASGELDRTGGPPKKRAPGPVRPDVLADAQRETGTTLQREAGAPLRFRSLHRNPQLVSERWGAATARIARILEGKPTSSSLVTACEQLGPLAVEYTDTYAHFLLRHEKPPADGKIDRNPFRGLSDKDASRKFMRLVEDICDRSTGKLGSWYVK